MASQQTLEEALCCGTVPLRLQINIYYFAVLIYCSPKVMLLAFYIYEDFIDVEGIAVASVLTFQSPSADRSEIDAPETDRFPATGDASPSEQIFNVTVA